LPIQIIQAFISFFLFKDAIFAKKKTLELAQEGVFIVISLCSPKIKGY
jgi:hypothetical protein